MRASLRRTVVAFAATSLLLTACGGDDGDTGAEGDTATQETDNGETAGQAEGGLSGELSVWIMQPGSEELEAVFEDTAAAFEEQNPDATVERTCVRSARSPVSLDSTASGSASACASTTASRSRLNGSHSSST